MAEARGRPYVANDTVRAARKRKRGFELHVLVKCSRKTSTFTSNAQCVGSRTTTRELGERGNDGSRALEDELMLQEKLFN